MLPVRDLTNTDQTIVSRLGNIQMTHWWRTMQITASTIERKCCDMTIALSYATILRVSKIRVEFEIAQYA